MPARLRLVKATGGAAEVLLLEPEPEPRPRGVEGPGPARAGAWRRAPCWQPAARANGRGRGGRTTRRRPAPGPAARRSRARSWPRAAAWPSRRTSTSRSPTPSATRPSTPTSRARWRRPTAGLHLTTEVLDRCRAAGADVHAVDLAVGLATFRPLPAARSRTTSCTPSATGSRRRPWRLPSRPAGWSPSAPRRCGPWRRPRPPASWRARATCSSDAGFAFAVVDVLMTNFHLPRSTLLLLLEAFCGTAVAGPVRGGAGRRLPVPVLR